MISFFVFQYNLRKKCVTIVINDKQTNHSFGMYPSEVNMYTLDELRIQENKAEKKTLVRFLCYQVLLFGFCLALLLLTDFFDRQALRLFPLALFLLGFSLTKMHRFLRPKEFRGKVVHLYVGIEHRKKYLSGQAGLTYAADKIKMLDLVAENENGKSRSVSVPYRPHYKDLKTGDQVILFRFLDLIYPIST